LQPTAQELLHNTTSNSTQFEASLTQFMGEQISTNSIAINQFTFAQNIQEQVCSDQQQQEQQQQQSPYLTSASFAAWYTSNDGSPFDNSNVSNSPNHFVPYDTPVELSVLKFDKVYDFVSLSEMMFNASFRVSWIRLVKNLMAAMEMIIATVLMEAKKLVMHNLQWTAYSMQFPFLLDLLKQTMIQAGILWRMDNKGMNKSFQMSYTNTIYC
jgi:hypothetical protein